ncbi:MAG: TonB-dependent receptor plug domain-containing protein [Litorimonas sp.]
MRRIHNPRLAVLVSLCLTTALTPPAFAARQVTDTLADDVTAAEGTATPIAVPAQNQENARDVYPADYFATYVPRTALDMVARIPGFQIRQGDTSRRGLGQGGANILINGERLTGKADPFAQLDQLLASSVVEIRIREGATLSIPGLSGQVADIIVKKSAKLKGTWEWNPQFRKRIEPNLTNGEINLNGEANILGGVTYAVTLRDYGFRSGARANETLHDGTGQLFETRVEDIQNTAERPGVAVNLGWEPKPDHKANLNAEYFLFNYNRVSPAVRTPVTAAGSDLVTVGRSSEDEWNFELDGDYELPLLSGRLKFTGVLDRESSPTSNRFSRYSPQTGFLGARRFDQTGEELELIGRAEYSWSRAEGRDWQVAVEGAYNELDIDQQLFTRDPGADFVGGPISGFIVSENRAETTLTHNRPWGPKWSLQASIGVEYSELMQERTGAEPSEPREFIRPKGFVSANYKASETFDIRTRIEREVGQLNFFDFVSSVDLEDNLGRSANPDLVPAQSWLASVEFDKNFGQGNTLKATLDGALISDTVDRIPIGANGDGVGNIGAATTIALHIESTLKGDRWNLPGTELNLGLGLHSSRVDDPVLDFSRRLNGDSKIHFDVSFRHDIPQTDWAYGAYMERNISAQQYRLFSIDRNGVDKPYASVFVEHKDVAGMTFNVNLGNLLGQEEFFERQRFTARRDVGVVQQSEEIKFNFGPILRLSLSGSF